MTSLKTATMASLLIAGVVASPSFAADSAGQKVDDATVLTRIKADLLQSKNVDGLDVNVDVKDGRVTLSGTAATDAERSKAESIAKNASGVRGVENKITLKAK